MPENPQRANHFFNREKTGGFIAGVITVILALLIYRSSQPAKDKLVVETKPLSFCEKLDILTHEQTKQFKTIKGKAFLNNHDTIWYRSTIDLGEDSSEISFSKDQQYFYRGFFTTKAKNDTVYLAKLYDSLRTALNGCLPEWEKYELDDVDRKFPFTRFVIDSIQIELYYMKNGYDSMYTFGLVVEEFK